LALDEERRGSVVSVIQAGSPFAASHKAIATVLGETVLCRLSRSNFGAYGARVFEQIQIMLHARFTEVRRQCNLFNGQPVSQVACFSQNSEDLVYN
jgi:hypothetical protein